MTKAREINSDGSQPIPLGEMTPWEQRQITAQEGLDPFADLDGQGHIPFMDRAANLAKRGLRTVAVGTLALAVAGGVVEAFRIGMSQNHAEHARLYQIGQHDFAKISQRTGGNLYSPPK